MTVLRSSGFRNSALTLQAPPTWCRPSKNGRRALVVRCDRARHIALKCIPQKCLSGRERSVVHNHQRPDTGQARRRKAARAAARVGMAPQSSSPQEKSKKGMCPYRSLRKVSILTESTSSLPSLTMQGVLCPGDEEDDLDNGQGLQSRAQREADLEKCGPGHVSGRSANTAA